MVEFHPVTAHIGAEVSGIDLRKEATDEEVHAIRQALLKHLVLFFRDQDITDEQHMAFALRFGTLNVPAMKTKAQTNPGITVLDQTAPKGEGGDEWHNDNTFMPNPPMGSLLRALQLPSVGGDTLFSNMYLAYETLSPWLRRLADDLVAVHDLSNSVKKAIAKGHPLNLEQMQRQWPPIERPVVITHPETGRKALFVNRSSVTHLKDLSPRENEAILPLLLDHGRSPEFQCRLRWRTGTMAFWDNRSMQHYAVADYTERRLMHRVTIDGPWQW